MSHAILATRWTAGLLAAAGMTALNIQPAYAAGPCNTSVQTPAVRNVDEGQSVSLAPNSFKDVETFSWVQTGGTPSVTLQNALSEVATFTAPQVTAAGTELDFKVTVTGCNATQSASSTIKVRVRDTSPVANQNPVAVASVTPSSPTLIYTGDLVTLDGSASYDPDGTALSYLWEQVSGTSVTLTPTATPAAVTFTAPDAPYPDGTSLTFKLTVSDGSLTGSTQQIVTVSWLNVAPTANASCPAYVDEKSSFTLDASGSTDPDDGIGSYVWSQEEGGPTATLGAPDTEGKINATAPSLVGPYDLMTFKLVVTDDGGLSDDDTCPVYVNDITPPVATPTQSPSANAAGWNNTDVTVNWDWADAGKGVDKSNCTQTSTSSGEGNPLTLTSSCTDLAGNLAEESYDLKVDKTAPAIAWNGDIDAGDVFYFSFVPASPTCTATDALSGVVDEACTVTGYSTAVGTHTLTATATDVAGNEAEVTRQYTVEAWTLKGFFQPVDMGGVWNTVKNGSTVPLKFEVFAGTTELTDVAVIDGFTVAGVACPGTGVAVDDIELTTTGGTALRYDSSGGQFIQNWQTPKKPGACYAVTMTTDDGSSISANFKLK